MYVTPRPLHEDDPLFPVRLASIAVIGLACIQLFQPAIPPLLIALPVGLLAAQRKAFNPAKAFGGPIAFIVIIWLMTALVLVTRDLPVLMLTLIFIIYFLAFFITRMTGSPIGMLVLIAASLMSIMGMKQRVMIFYFRDGFIQGALIALIAIPILYWLLPPRTQHVHEDENRPAYGHFVAGALIRAVVMMGMTFWLYAVLPAQDMLLAVAAVFVLVFPTRKEAFAEAKERVYATVIGSGVGLLVLWLLAFSAHFMVLACLIFLAALFFGDRMIHGRHPAMVYQFALSATVALVAGALSTQSPGSAAMMRVGLTFGGAISATMLVALLEALLLKPLPEQPEASDELLADQPLLQPVTGVEQDPVRDIGL
ncbi:FUSC family protein [Thalassovita taeanensis]|uniref:Fusaric acid resistance protein-like n=1 Tax=Thalassovita taeanensis TaxID=657014 RepID=A0A1H9DIQ7_9RHOB|nr:FUSC family protein [Thalassovita taeanensis]SEQ12628.1 Fusaric acid resistance protein-like [Thalassovita taeanensis]